MNVVLEDRDSMHAYAYGMVSGMRSRLLARRELELMAQAGSVDEVLSMFEGTRYGDETRRLSKGFSLSDVEGILADDFKQNYCELASTLPEDERNMLDAVFPASWDLENLKTVCRAVRSKAGEKALDGILSTGMLGRERLRELSAAEDVSALPAMLPQPYRVYVEKALEKDSTTAFEEELDRLFLKDMLDAADGSFAAYVRTMVDILNVRTVLRCKLGGVDAAEHVLWEGRYITRSRLEELLRQDAEGVAKALEGTPYHDAARDTVSESAEGSLEDLDLRLQRILDREVEYDAVAEPLTVKSVIAYLRLKRREVNNLLAILAGKWFRLDGDTVKGLIS